MDRALNEYLEKIEKYLKPLVVSERVDIVKEIKSEMLELQGNGVSSEKIIERLGDPNDYSGPLAHPGRSLAQLDRASAHSTRSAVQPMLAADQHTC